MAFSVTTQARKAGDTVYYDPRFRTVIETHLPLLRTHPNTQRQAITPDVIHQFEGDFYGLLIQNGIPMHLHWIYLRVNYMNSPNQFGAQLRDPYRDRYEFTLLIPPEDTISELRKLFLTTQR